MEIRNAGAAMALIPAIRTGRLELRAMRLDDFDRYAEIWADPDVVRYIGGPRSKNDCWGQFLQNVGQWQMYGIGQWAIVEPDSQRMIGQTGMFYAHRGLGADFDACPEAGWVLASEAHGKGFGPEAVTAAHDWFDRTRPGPLVVVMSEANTASRRVSDGLGYKLQGRAEMAGEPVILLRRETHATAETD